VIVFRLAFCYEEQKSNFLSADKTFPADYFCAGIFSGGALFVILRDWKLFQWRYNFSPFMNAKKMQHNILLIDDSTIDLRVLIELMSVRQMRVHIAFNGQDGYHKASMQQPDLILLDVSMPVMDGFATCRMLKNNERTHSIPVIFLSAANEVEKRIEGLSLGAVDYIGKPFSEQEVIARVSIHLNLARHLPPPVAVINPDEFDALDGLVRRDAVLIRTATDYLRQHLSLPPSPEILAKILGTNEKRLNQAFQSGFAMPVFAWLREERLRQARELLASTETPISNIGEYVGYSSGANFSKAFRERFSCSPRELRVELQRGSQQKEIEENQ
jgi:DNA-binding response OmpR family regulator